MDSKNSLSISDLPPYIIIHIFKFITNEDLLFSVRNTCHSWSQLSKEKVLWRTLDVKNFPNHVFTPWSFLQHLRDTSNSIESLHFDLLQHDLKIIKHEGTVCPNLKEISIGIKKRDDQSISAVDVNNCLSRLSEKYPNLTKLCVMNQVLLIEDIFRNLEEFVYESVDRSVGRIRVKVFLTFHVGLKHITLRRCILSVATVTKILTEYKELETLDLSGSTSMFDEVNHSMCVEDINACKLKILNLSETDVVDGLLRKVAQKARDLQYLNIAKCQRLTNAALESVAKNCLGLRKLIINVDEVSLSEGQCDVTCSGIERIAESCPHLTVLKINHCPEVGDSGVAAIVNACHELVELEVAGCLSLQDATVLSIVRNCPRMQRLNLGGCPQLTGKSVSSVLKHCRNLKYLNIETCHRVTDFSLLEKDKNDAVLELYDTEEGKNKFEGVRTTKVELLSESLESGSVVEIKEDDDNTSDTFEGSVLHGDEEEMNREDLKSGADSQAANLPISKFDNIPSEPYLELLKNHSHVTVLNLSFCSKISNSCLKQIAQHCADLRELDIQACYMVTNAGVRELLKHCRFLKILNISGGSLSQTSRLTDECLGDIVEYGKSITKLVIVKNYNITADAVFTVIQNCEEIQSVRVETSKRSNISTEVLIDLSGRVKDKTICIKFRADVEILVYKDAEFKIRYRD